MTIDEIASFCEFRDCKVSAGHPEHGFIHLDGTGLEDRSYTYGRFHMLSEVASLPSPRQVLEHADTFKVTRGAQTRTLTREEFESELRDFQRKAGVI